MPGPKVPPVGHYIECPHCQLELRINRRFLGQRVCCKFCNGLFLHDLNDPGIRVVAVYTTCPHCAEDIRDDPALDPYRFSSRADTPATYSREFVQRLMEQFFAMHESMMSQTEEQMALMAQCFSTAQDSQNEISRETRRIEGIAEDLLRAENDR